MLKTIRRKLFSILRNFLNRRGFVLIRWKKQGHLTNAASSGDENGYLVNSNPKLVDLIDKYKTMSKQITNSHVWNWDSKTLSNGMLRSFRGDTAYVWQLKGVDLPELRYLTSTYYQLANDTFGLLNKFNDDALFGNYLFKIGDRTVSREILDSANEINFLERHLELSKVTNLRILDIGAGYGRLAHRMSQAFSNLHKYYCTDGVPVSAFICDFYIHYRKIKNAEMVPMPDLLERLSGENIFLAVNIHSFSECSLDSIDWWVKQIATLAIPYLMIIPNAFEEEGSRLLTNRREDFSFILKKYGYSLLVKEPKYLDSLMQKFGLYPSYYYLFKFDPLTMPR